MDDLNDYKNEIPWCRGILFRAVNAPNYFISVKFGTGCNADVLEEGHDDYLMIEQWRINTDLELECSDGAMMEFNQDESDYDGCILKAIPDALAYIESDISDLEPITKL